MEFNNYGESLDSTPDFLFLKKIYLEDLEDLEICENNVKFETLIENKPDENNDLQIVSEANPLAYLDNLIKENQPTNNNEEIILRNSLESS
jgi:hypothetical protein